MASLFRDRAISYSRRDSAAAASPSSATSRLTATSNVATFSTLPSPFGDLTPTLSAADLRASAYEIFLSAARSASTKPLTYIPSSNHGNLPNNSSSSNGNSSSTLQRSLTSTAASKMNKALGMRSSSSNRSSDDGSPSNSGSGGKVKKPMTLGELMRVQMRVTEAMDTRLRRGLLRLSASQIEFGI